MARRFRPAFDALVAFEDRVVVSDTKAGVVFARAKADVTLPDGTTVRRTVMAFGDDLLRVHPAFAPGESARLSVRFDGGTVRVVGPARGTSAAA